MILTKKNRMARGLCNRAFFMLKKIKQITEEEFNLPDISRRTRKHPYPEARAVYYAVAKETMIDVSLSRIARKMGRNHATAIYGIKKLKDTYLREKKFRILHKKVMDRAAMELEKEGFSELEILRQENIELKRKLEDLIHRDISRCNDYKCPIAPFCERYLQMAIDYKKGEKLVAVTDFKGREKVGLCDHFLNIDVGQ